MIHEGQLIEALHMADAALAANPSHTPSLNARLAALQALEATSQNTNELGWLRHAINQTQSALNP